MLFATFTTNLLRNASKRKRKSVQRELYKAHRAFVGRSLLDLLLPRLRRFYHPTTFPDQHIKNMVEISMAHARKAAPSTGWNLIRAWSNAWCTDARVGIHPVSPCRFGCPCKAHDMVGATDREEKRGSGPRARVESGTVSIRYCIS